MPIPLAFMDSSVIDEVSLELWRKAFDAVGWPLSLQDKRDTFAHDEMLEAFQRDAVSDDLLEALETIHSLGTEKGREAIDEVLADRRIPLDDIPKGLGARELALHLFLLQRTEGPIAEVLARAHAQVEEGRGRRYNDFTGEQPKRLKNLRANVQALEKQTRDYCARKDLGDHVEVQVFDDHDGTYRFRIMRSHHTQSRLVVMPGSTKGRTTIKLTPVHSDMVRYEPAIGRLRITARAASVVEFYRRTFGLVFFDDETFFYGEAVCSLRVLQERGRAALDVQDVFGVGRIRMTECVWERGDGKRLHIHDSEDCFNTIEELGLPLIEGKLLQAKLKIQVAGKSARPLIANVRVPSRIDMNDSREALANEVLEKIGIRNSAHKARAVTLWSLYPWRHPLEDWRDLFGAETDALVRSGVLKPVMLKAVESPEHPGAGRVLQAVQVAPGEFQGVSLMEEVPSRSLSATNLEALELDVEAYQAHLRAMFGIVGNAARWSPEHALLDLGVLKIHNHSLHVMYALREPPPDAGALLKDRAGSSLSALLLPAPGSAPNGAAGVLLDGPLPSVHRAKCDMVLKAGLASLVPALYTAPPGASLVVDKRFGLVWYDGVEISGLKPGTHPFSLVEILARECPKAISLLDISAELTNRKDGDQPARHAKSDANRALKKATLAAGRKYVEPFKTEDGCYRATVLCHLAGTDIY